MHTCIASQFILGSFLLLLRSTLQFCCLRGYPSPIYPSTNQPVLHKSRKMDKSKVHSTRQSDSKLSTIETLIGKTAKHFVVGTVCLVVWLTDSILPTYYVGGGVANSILSKVLKKIIRQPRPQNSPKGGHGMPSSHSQSILYFASVLWWKASELVFSPSSSQAEYAVALIGSIIVLLYSYYACVFRISTGRHTIEQTLVGAIVGIITGSCAYYIETTDLRYILPPSLMSYTPLWFRYFMIASAAVILYRKDLMAKLSKSK